MSKKVSKRKENRDLHPVMCPQCSKGSGNFVSGAVWVAVPPKGAPLYSESENRDKHSKEYLESNPGADPLDWVRLKDSVPILSKIPCAVCIGKNAGMARLVEEGGIYLKCLKCNLVTALSPNHKVTVETVKNNPKNKDKPIVLSYQGCDLEGDLIPNCRVFEEYNAKLKKEANQEINKG